MLAKILEFAVHDTSLELTLASVKALEPSVVSIAAADPSTVLKPSTARSATTGPAEILERSALCAGFHISKRRGGDYEWRTDYQLSIRQWPTFHAGWRAANPRY